MANIFAKLGAVVYVIWGVLHIEAARKVYALAETLEPGMVQGRLEQDAWYLLFFALFGIAVGIALNWKNSSLGYWLNLIVISAADLGYIIFVLIPGYVPVMPGAIGPIVWLVALSLSTLALFSSAKQEA